MKGDAGTQKGPSYADRFWSHVARHGDGCWPWLGARDPNGYGRVKRAGRVAMAHRVAYELARGTIGERLVLDHLCRNRWCVNPEHLEAVTSRENSMRGEAHQFVAARTGLCRRGHQFAYRDRHGRQVCRECDTMRKAARRAARKAGCA